jgi:NADH-quinone oxidoreductase subunit A
MGVHIFRIKAGQPCKVEIVETYSFIGIFLLIALTMPAIVLVLAYLLQPRRPTPIKQETYECGLEAVGDIWVQFKIQYYLYALIFVVFDVEVVLLYPIAVAFQQLDVFALVATLVFLFILVYGLVYEWRKGALQWV